jgi:sugar transferase (PEP-CTERM/EpsH1 system associated)
MRVLFLTHRLPYAPNRGDRIRAYHVLKTLAGRAEVDLFSLVHDDDEASRAGDIGGLAASVTVARAPWLRNRLRGIAALPGRRTLTHVLLDAPGARAALARLAARRPPDIVLAYCSSMARFALEPPLDRYPFVLDMVDVDSEKWAGLARTARAPLCWIYAREARLLAGFEAHAARRAHATLVVNERERTSLARIAPEADIHVVPNGVDLDAFRPKDPPSAEARVVFCGVMSYPPNEQGSLWLAREVWPLVRARRPDARLGLVGADPTQAVRRLALDDPSIEVTGTVPDVRPHLWRAAVAAAPLLTARGLQNKVLEALAAGLPCVTTPAVFEGLPPEVAPGCYVAAAPAAFADALCDLLACPPDARRSRALQAELAALAWPARLAPILGMIEGAARRASRPAGARPVAP